MRSKRKITSNKTLRWTDGIIPYVFGISDGELANYLCIYLSKLVYINKLQLSHKNRLVK